MSSSKGRIFIGKSGLLVDEVEFLQKDKELNLWDEEIERKFLEIEREFLKKIKLYKEMYKECEKKLLNKNKSSSNTDEVDEDLDGLDL